MAQRARAPVRDRERGFTLIELLVVIVIIGILVSIALPTFLRQRQKAWDNTLRSDLRNAALAETTWMTESGSYTANVTDLQSVGFKFSDAGSYANAPASITITANGADSFCLSGQSRSGRTLYYDSNLGGTASTC